MELATTLVWIVGWVLAVARLTRFTTSDALTDGLREHVYAHYGNDGKAAYFSECPWCQSIWYGAGTAWFVILQTGISWWTYPILVLAGSYIVGLLAEREDDGDEVQVTVT